MARLAAIVAAIFLPAGFLTGLLGIDVGGIPGSDDPRGFAIVGAGLGFLVAAMIWMFRRNRWLQEGTFSDAHW